MEVCKFELVELVVIGHAVIGGIKGFTGDEEAPAAVPEDVGVERMGDIEGREDAVPAHGVAIQDVPVTAHFARAHPAINQQVALREEAARMEVTGWWHDA
jgi:hypothetical protein